MLRLQPLKKVSHPTLLKKVWSHKKKIENFQKIEKRQQENIVILTKKTGY